jgi:hypothetical protein
MYVVTKCVTIISHNSLYKTLQHFDDSCENIKRLWKGLKCSFFNNEENDAEKLCSFSSHIKSFLQHQKDSLKFVKHLKTAFCPGRSSDSKNASVLSDGLLNGSDSSDDNDDDEGDDEDDVDDEAKDEDSKKHDVDQVKCLQTFHFLYYSKMMFLVLRQVYY